MTRRAAGLAGMMTVPAFFVLKIGSALALLAASTAWLPVADFAEFTQLMILAALLNLAAIGGAQNGLVRMTAAAASDQEVARAHGAALAIWFAVVVVLGLLAALLRGPISTVLVGDERAAGAALSVVLLTLAGGPGQVFTSILTGRHRPGASLLAQGCGLVASTAGALWLLRQGDASGAAVAFAAGPLVAMLAALPPYLAERLPRPSLGGVGQEVRLLLGFSGATAAVAGFTSLVLFGLRAVYREQFGLETLGYWLAANRISDTTTQFLGLAILQLFLPRYTAMEDEAGAHRLVFITWAAGVAIMAGGLAVFALASEFWVRLFLSPAFLPAIAAILLYMTGDVLRVWAAVAMNAQLARGKPWLFAGIEIGTLALMGVLTIGGIAAGMTLAPMLGYLAAYAVTALCVTVWFVRGHLAAKRPVPPATEGADILT